MRHSFLLALVLTTSAFAGTSTVSPTTTNNDDSCDIALQPAATLLLPYFEVDFRTHTTTTLFTIENVSNLPQIANVTLWTDYAYPMMSFPIFLTGYDVQGIDLYDVFARGIIALGPTPGTGGTSSSTFVPTNPTGGSQPAENDANRNFLADVPTICANLPGLFSRALLADLQSIFTTGKSSIACPTAKFGGVHANAIGYVTVDVVATCSPRNASSAEYFATSLLFDNVLGGDYQQIHNGYASGGPMVHIRAIPEGGPVGALTGTNLPYTFYDRFTGGVFSRTIDRRQPLPSLFAARFVQSDNGQLSTTFKIWREGISSGAGACSTSASNADMPRTEVVRFDEHENATILTRGACSICLPDFGGPAVSALSAADTTLLPPFSTSGDAGGWMYLNLNNGGSSGYSTARPWSVPGTIGRQSQNWVITSMFAPPSYAVESSVLSLGNGCTPPPSSTTNRGVQIGPAPNPTP
jgi:hypothetical protein